MKRVLTVCSVVMMTCFPALAGAKGIRNNSNSVFIPVTPISPGFAFCAYVTPGQFKGGDKGRRNAYANQGDEGMNVSLGVTLCVFDGSDWVAIPGLVDVDPTSNED